MNFRFAGHAVVAVTALLAAYAAFAHHSIGGQFDENKPVTISGVITQVNWVNPHIYVMLDVKDTAGNPVTWRLECVPVAMARKAGLSKTLLMGEGGTVTAEVFPARDGTSHLGFMRKLTYPDGRFYQFAADAREAPPAR